MERLDLTGRRRKVKKVYSAPTITTLGDIREITRGRWGLSFVEGFFQKKPDPRS
jgi:hypothetical protein